MNNQYEDQSTIHTCLNEVLRVNDTGIFSNTRVSDPFFRPSIVWVLIHLYDGLRASERLGERCDLCGPEIFAVNEGDLTSLFSAARAAACHVTSGKRTKKFKEANDARLQMEWVIGLGKGPVMKKGDHEIVNLFDDDILLIFGDVQFYVLRNMIGAYEWLRTRYCPDMPIMSIKRQDEPKTS